MNRTSSRNTGTEEEMHRDQTSIWKKTGGNTYERRLAGGLVTLYVFYEAGWRVLVGGKPVMCGDSYTFSDGEAARCAAELAAVPLLEQAGRDLGVRLLNETALRDTQDALEYALHVIKNYQIDIRATRHHGSPQREMVGGDLVVEGFCQGDIYRTALRDIRRRARQPVGQDETPEFFRLDAD